MPANRRASQRPGEVSARVSISDRVERIDPSWVVERGRQQERWKSKLSHYAAHHLGLDHGMVLQLASGTQATVLMKSIIRRQVDTGRSLDLSILTTNLEVLKQVRDARFENARLFGSMQAILTGGFLHFPTNSLVGEYAARHVRTEEIKPDFVFLGAKGLSFKDGKVTLVYHFEEQLSTQRSYATRPTKHRVIICDHTKLGERSGWKVDLTPEQMLAETDECTFICSCPDDDADQGTIAAEEAAFRLLLQNLKRDPQSARKQFRLRLIGEDEEVPVKRELSLPAGGPRLKQR